MSSERSAPFLGGLESLRGLAALDVALFHVAFTNPTWGWGVVRNGYLLVDLFFVLSGFVMSHAYLGRLTTGQQVKEYLWLRLGRVYPLHLLTLAVFVAIEATRWVAERGGQALATPAFSTNGLGALLANMLMVHAHGVTKALTFNGPSWSIAAELWAYLAFAVFAVQVRAPRTRLTLAAAISLGLYVAMRVFHPANIDLTFDFGVVRCLAGFFLGIVTFEVTRRIGAGSEAVCVGAGVVLVALLATSTDGSLDYAVPSASAVLIGAVALTRGGRFGRLLELKPLVWLGKVSFSVYMVHTAVLRVVSAVLKKAAHGEQNSDGLLVVAPTWGVVGVLVYVIVLLATSGLMYRFVEDPARRWAKQMLGPPAQR